MTKLQLKLLLLNKEQLKLNNVLKMKGKIISKNDKSVEIINTYSINNFLLYFQQCVDMARIICKNDKKQLKSQSIFTVCFL